MAVVLSSVLAIKWVLGAIQAGMRVAQVLIWEGDVKATEAELLVAARALVSWRFTALPGQLSAGALKQFAQLSWEQLQHERDACVSGAGVLS